MNGVSKEERRALLRSALEKAASGAVGFTSDESAALSDLDRAEARTFREAWRGMRSESRLFLFRELRAALAADDILDYTAIQFAGLEDPEETVRVEALRALPEDVPAELVPALCDCIQDRSESVRIAAIEAAVKAFSAGSGEADPVILSALEKARARAAGREALVMMEAFAAAEDPRAEAMIAAAFAQRDPLSIASALRAVRNSFDGRWAENVLSSLDETDAEIVLEAIRAAGALALETAAEPLLRMLLSFERYEPAAFPEIILALGKIGGDLPRKVIRFLEESLAEDSGLSEVLELANESLEISDFERAIDRLSAAGTDASASEFWGSDEAYLDQLATAMDLYLERNGLFAEDEDEELSPLHAHARSQGHSGGEISADEIDPSDPQYAHRGELDFTRFREIDAAEIDGSRRKRTFLDWSDEEVAAFRAATAGCDFDWEAFLRENEDE